MKYLNSTSTFIAASSLMATMMASTAQAAPTEFDCAANADWIYNPTLPAEIPGGGKNLCQFYQYSWQSFIALMNTNDSGVREYRNSNMFSSFQGTGKNSCASDATQPLLFVRALKDPMTTAADFTRPNEMNQAFGNSVIYDQNHNIVLYEALFSKAMCDLPKDSKTLPAGTTEIKASWRTITESEKADYIWIQSDTNDNGKFDNNELFGMVGFHLVKSTPTHPEFIWATFEHRNNAPNCQDIPIPEDTNRWSFTSATCAAELPRVNEGSGCQFNDAEQPAKPDDSPLTGPPTEICQVYQYGTKPGDNQAAKNLGNISSINQQLGAMFAKLPAKNTLSVLQNYQVVGAIWENDVSQPSSDESNLRGSIQLANVTMETNVQEGFGAEIYVSPDNLKPAAHCFDCHGYDGPSTNAKVSHIFSKIHGQ
ncbi:hypothetical protein [Echinimonas agarilytica]|uniref:EF-hand domain-containing protein n=1 Tax=Echinimonas agarilytica TaxID=1215918 RepID=A0AA42B9G7_9GAMM|nr:hypothetical protein [Echinimonas agarilytica]MCM2681086.1 hypothetical protein [Echinimonas agarilytica]